MGQSVWHGSQHTFDCFSRSAIGSGEGSQAFGWGLYFAANRAVAEYYQETLCSPGEALGWYVEQNEAGDWIVYDAEDGILDAFEDEAEADAMVACKGPGQLCLVEIPADLTFLLWDKPAQAQPVRVRDALAALAIEPGGVMPTLNGVTYDFNIVVGEGIYGYLSALLGGDKQASQALAEQGVAGIKYQDGLTRGMAVGTYNYVVFDDQAVTLLEVHRGTAVVAMAPPPVDNDFACQ